MKTDNPLSWGRELITTGDYDPLYIALCGIYAKGSWGQDRIARFLLSYWLCYSVGASAFLSSLSGQDYWEMLQIAAVNEQSPSEFAPVSAERWPRAAERRHWRGKIATTSTRRLTERWQKPEDAVCSLFSCRSLADVQAKLKDWPQFGPWITFKVADMMECVLGVPIDFPVDVISFYKDPRLGAEMAAPLMGNIEPQAVVEAMLLSYSDLAVRTARPREVRVQEVETVLCKWKSARRSHYRIGKDTVDHRRELKSWSQDELASFYPETFPLDVLARRG